MPRNPEIPGNTLLAPVLRAVIVTGNAAFRPDDRYGAPREDMDWLPLSGDRGSAFECFLIRFKAGAASTAHEHTGGEEFYVLDGELTDCDGTVFRRGDYVCYRPGSRHFSVSRAGCTLLTILHGRNAPLSESDPA